MCPSKKTTLHDSHKVPHDGTETCGLRWHRLESCSWAPHFPSHKNWVSRASFQISWSASWSPVLPSSLLVSLHVAGGCWCIYQHLPQNWKLLEPSPRLPAGFRSSAILVSVSLNRNPPSRAVPPPPWRSHVQKGCHLPLYPLNGPRCPSDSRESIYCKFDTLLQSLRISTFHSISYYIYMYIYILFIIYIINNIRIYMIYIDIYYIYILY